MRKFSEIEGKQGLLKKLGRRLALVFLAYCVASITFVNIAFGVFFSRSDIDRINPISSYSEIDGNEFPRQEVFVQSGANSLCGYIYGLGDSKGLIVLVHGIGSCADDHLAEIMGFVIEGWTVFAFDETGVASSEGASSVGLVQAKLDLRAVLAYIQERDDLSALPLFLYGHSMGGYAVTSVLSEGYNVSAVVCISGFNDPIGVIDYELGMVNPLLAAIEKPFVTLHSLILFREDAFIRAVDVINENPDVPILCIYGTEDEIIPADIIGIPAYRSDLKHDNVTFYPIDDDGKNGHSALWLNAQAAKYVTDVEGAKLSSLYGGDIGDSLDMGYMQLVESFYSAAI